MASCTSLHEKIRSIREGSSYKTKSRLIKRLRAGVLKSVKKDQAAISSHERRIGQGKVNSYRSQRL